MMMNPFLTSRSASPPVSQAYQTAMEDLAKLLQDTGSSVERILTRYGSPIGVRADISEVRTSLSMGTPTLNRDTGKASSSIPAQIQVDHGRAALHHHAVQNWFTRTQPETVSLASSLPRTDPLSFNKQGKHADEHALKGLLEEIQTTIRDWSARQRVLQVKAASTKDAARGGGVRPSGGSNPGLKQVFNESLGSTDLDESQQEDKEKEDGGTHHNFLPHPEKKATDCVPEAKLTDEANVDKVVGDDRASELLQTDAEKPREASQLEQGTSVSTSGPSNVEKESPMLSPENVNVEQGILQSNPQETNVAEPTTTALPYGLVTPTKTNQAEGELPLTAWKPPTSAAKNVKTPISRLPVEVITSPDWLPAGWVTELKTRGSGNSAGTKDKYYVEPKSQRRFRSRKEVIAFLERGNSKLEDSPETSPVKKLLGPELLLPPPKKTSKKAKHKESSTPSSSSLPPSMVPSITSPGRLGNMLMPPFRTGQPSEWLVYESLASLQFPMFDPFYYADLNASKSSGSKGPNAPTRPWFFSGPEASWSPFMDRSNPGKSGDKGSRDYHSYLSMPPYTSYTSEGASKLSISRKSSKRKSAGPL